MGLSFAVCGGGRGAGGWRMPEARRRHSRTMVALRGWPRSPACMVSGTTRVAMGCGSWSASGLYRGMTRRAAFLTFSSES